MSRSMEGKVIAITGGASGMGFATAKLLIERGAKVSIADISPDLETAAVELARHSGIDQFKGVYAHKVNVRDLAEVELWLKATVEQLGRLDGAVNAAGIFDYPLPTVLWHEKHGIDTWDKVVGVNLTGVANCLHAELGILTSPEAKAGNWGKSIVNLSSVAG
ncbi:putative short-chain dehydrogenase/reductase SDR, NAD(P)-binding domain superfamily [Septoria linicola]|nr:putative short-chain dehydrogenase/reductase SDR, NAD(P)-binding domain superfamily [Septoria linicola]